MVCVCTLFCACGRSASVLWWLHPARATSMRALAVPQLRSFTAHAVHAEFCTICLPASQTLPR